LGVNPDWTIPLRHSVRIGGEVNNVVASHTRLVGAWTEKDIVDYDLMGRTWIHAFTRKEDPNLMTADEMTTEETYIRDDFISTRERRSIDIAPLPLMEHGDYVSFDGAFWKIDGYSFNVSAADDGQLSLSGNIVVNASDDNS
jgi:hypothetical protein